MNTVIDFSSDTAGLQHVVDALQAIIQKNGEVGQAWARTSAQIDAYNKQNVTGTTSLGKSIESLATASKTLDKSIIGGAYKDYLKQIQAQLGLTSKELVTYIQNARQAAQQAIFSAQTDDEVKELTLSIEVMNEKLKDLGVSEFQTESKVSSLRTQLRQMREELASLQEGTPEFEALRQKAGELDDKIKDLNATISHTGSDTKNLDGLISLASGVAGGFAAAQGAAALFGDENEDLQKALLKVNAAMSILQGLQQVQNVLQKESAASILLNAGARGTQTAAVAAETVAETANAAATEAVAVAEGEQAVAATGATAAQTGLNTAMSLNPVGIVIVAVLALVEAYKALTSATKENAQIQTEENIAGILPENAFSTALTQIENFTISAVNSFKKLQVQKEELDRALAKAARPDASSADIANATALASKTAADQEESNQQLRVAAVQAGQSIINQIYADSAAKRQEQLQADLTALEDQKNKELNNK